MSTTTGISLPMKKLRRAEEWTGQGCTGNWGGQLVKTALAGLEQAIEAKGQTETDAELLAGRVL